MKLAAVSHIVTRQLGLWMPNKVPLIFVIGYPKSGTTWVAQLVADYLRLPYPQHALLPITFRAVVHGHEQASKRFPTSLYVMRDGRDALVSQYFQFVRNISTGDHPPMSRRQRTYLSGLVNKKDVRTNLPRFIEKQMIRPAAGAVNWGRHVRSILEADFPGAALLRYEDLVQDGPTVLADAMAKLTGERLDMKRAGQTVDRFSFKRQANRPAGSEDRSSFLRKGQPGDWRNHFTLEAAKIFDRYCGQTLIKSGYEKDHTWVQQVAVR